MAKLSKTTKRVLLGLLAIVFVLILLAVGWFRAQSYELPALTPSPEADSLARAMMKSVNHEAWLDTGAVTWTFRGQHVHLWDRDRQLARVAWTDDGPTLVEVFLDLDSRDGIVLVAKTDSEGHGADLAPPDAQEQAKRLRQAWEFWVNDSFWLNPIAKVFDAGTTRGLVAPEAGEFDDDLRGLLVSYASGGVTPGDSYLWLVGADDRPVAWRMWTQILPIQGLETSWEGWQDLATGAVVSTRHQTPLGALGLSDVYGAASLEELHAQNPVVDAAAYRDPFADLVDYLGQNHPAEKAEEGEAAAGGSAEETTSGDESEAENAASP